MEGKKEFDLNIEKVLENWSVSNAVREIIANALDEQLLSSSEEIRIFKDSDENWHIRDFGRGLKYVHLTQNENEEKLSHPQLIGKFGVGLKDALATFDRNGIGVSIDSKYGHITIGHTAKHGFNDITTLHAYISDPLDSRFAGTDFCLSGCSEDDINVAKNCFLRFTSLKCYEKTDYGDIYSTREGKPEIFINGVKVADEENFLFSYNITSLNASLRKALNRERTNVGRSAYSERVRNILLSVKSNEVVEAFTANLTEMGSGRQCDEMKWVDVQTHAVKLLHARKSTVFVTQNEFETLSGSAWEAIQESGKKVVYVPDTVMKKISNETDTSGGQISTISTVIAEYNKTFVYEFVSCSSLSKQEQQVFDLTLPIIELLGSRMKPEQVYISEKLRADTVDATVGVYEREKIA